VTTLQAFNSLVELIKKTKANPLIKGQGSNVVWELPLLSSIIGFCREGEQLHASKAQITSVAAYYRHSRRHIRKDGTPAEFGQYFAAESTFVLGYIQHLNDGGKRCTDW